MADYKKPSEQEVVMALDQLGNELNSAKSSLQGFEARIYKKEAAGTHASPTGIQVGAGIDQDKQAVQVGKEVIEPVTKKVELALNIAPALGTRFLK